MIPTTRFAEPYDPSERLRLPSDEWLDDHQQGLHPGGSEPKFDPYERFLAMPVKPSLLDLMRSDLETKDLQKPPPSPMRAPPESEPPVTSMCWDFDYVRDEPPTVRRIQQENQSHSTPRADTRTTIPRLRPAPEMPRPRAASAPPAAHPAKRLAVQYLPTTEEITPPATPQRADAITPEKAPVNSVDIDIVPDTPPAVVKPGRSRGRGKWRPQQKPAPRVGTRSSSRIMDIERRELEEAQGATARWPAQPPVTAQLETMTSVRCL